MKPGERGVLQAADRGEDAERVGRVGGVPVQRGGHHGGLVRSMASSMPVPRPVTSAGRRR